IILIIFLLNFLLIDYRYNFFRYEVTPKEIIFQKGFIFRSITYVPFSRIQHIETEQGPFLRREELMELIIHTVATDHSIAGLSIEEAQMIRQNVMKKVEETDEYGE
ncbi:MAG: PH domain-containing protein, partial [Alkalibacterium sp.]|nr:PH domain-containing protein [Alkalibacterium sp.]